MGRPPKENNENSGYIFDHPVKHNGKYYDVGEVVPMTAEEYKTFQDTIKSPVNLLTSDCYVNFYGETVHKLKLK